MNSRKSWTPTDFNVINFATPHYAKQTAELFNEMSAIIETLEGELSNISNAKRFVNFSDDREFADWVQSRARAALG